MKAIESLEKKKIIEVKNGWVRIIAEDIRGKDLTKEENQIITKLLMTDESKRS